VIDFKHQWKDRKYFIEGNIILSQVSGSKTAITETQTALTHLFQRVDAKHVNVDPNRTSLTGTGGKILFGKVGGGNWNYFSGLTWRSPELELNDIGFLRQADQIFQIIEIDYNTLKPVGAFRSIRSSFKQFSTYDFDGNFNRLQFDLNGHAEFKNYWSLDFGLSHKPRIYTNTILRGGPRFRYSRENISFLFIGLILVKKLDLMRVMSIRKPNKIIFHSCDLKRA